MLDDRMLRSARVEAVDFETPHVRTDRHHAAVQASLNALLAGASMNDAAAAADAVMANEQDRDKASA